MAITNTTLAAALSETSLSANITSTTGMAVGDRVIVDNEIMTVQQVVNGTFARVQRGQGGTQAVAHAIAVRVAFGPQGDFAAPPDRLVDGPPALKLYTAAGAIGIQAGTHVLRGGGVLAMTLASPAVEDDGKALEIITDEAEAHTVTLTAGFNGGGTGTDVGTFGGAIGDGLVAVAVNGVWLVRSNQNVTLA